MASSSANLEDMLVACISSLEVAGFFGYNIYREGKYVNIIERLSMTFTANGKNETSPVCLQLSVQ